jgi:hypothetical protein
MERRVRSKVTVTWVQMVRRPAEFNILSAGIYMINVPEVVTDTVDSWHEARMLEYYLRSAGVTGPIEMVGPE